MNLTIFKSIHALIALVVCGLFIGWLIMIGAAPGPVKGGDVNYLLWSGWIAFFLMVIVCLYAGRKYIHRWSKSPEFGMRVPIEKIRLVDSRINDLRRKIAAGQLREVKEVQRLADLIVAEGGCRKVLSVDVDQTKEGRLRIVVKPSERFGRMLPWLHAHAYYGIASGVLTWLHGGGKFDEPMGIALNALTFIVIATGIWGWILWGLAPRWLTRAETDMNYEQKFVYSQRLGEKLEEDVLAKMDDDRDLAKTVRRVVGKKPEVVQREIGEAMRRKPEAAALLQDAMVIIGQKYRVEKGMGELARIHAVMSIWRAVHVPFSIALMVVVVVHILQVWWY